MLTDQVQGIISELVTNFINNSEKLPLGRANNNKHLNGDMRALLLVNTTRPDHLSPALLKALQVLRERLVAAERALTASMGEQSQEGMSFF